MPGRTDSTDFEDLLKEAVREPALLAPRTSLLDGRFAIRRLLGSGGMGVVYEAFDRERDTAVALKTLIAMDASGVYRLKQEFRSLADVTHPNLVTLHELFSDGDHWYFTMDLVPGGPLFAGASPRLDAHRLRPVFAQLAAGIQAIHDAGQLHRDLKPTNVMLTPDARVVILDFGLASDQRADGPGETLPRGGVSGTPLYMAPEQATGDGASRASDWYAFGVMLFEALTGELPFGGDTRAVLGAKQREAAPSPSSIRSDVPEDLEGLCVSLLQRDPRARAGFEEVVQVLGPAEGTRDSRRAAEPTPFVGRAAELATLNEAFEATDRGVPVVTFVHGASGVGKTALVERFLDGLRREGKAVVLSGRCYERESVPFKACDSLIDALSRYLRRLPAERAASLLPMNVHAIAQLFPALRRLDVIRKTKQRHPLPPDTSELRRVAFEAFKELFARVAAQEPLVLFVDDLQWSDVDGAKLLSSILSRPNPPPLLHIAAHRSDEEQAGSGLSVLRQRIARFEVAEVRDLSLGELVREEAEALARDLLPAERSHLTGHIAREAAGNPFFITELCRFAALARDRADPIGFEHAVRQRLAALYDSERETLQAICLSAHPIDPRRLRVATDAGDIAPTLRKLQADHLVRTIAHGTSSKVGVYHDRIREVVVAGMEASRLRSCHAQLARAIAASEEPDLIALTDHLVAAGERAQAGATAVRAADHAAQALAFENAARLYRLALDLSAGDGESRRELQCRLGRALAHAGRGAEAAPVFIQAAEGAPPEQRQDLRQLAAHHWMATGHLTEGLRELEAMLEGVGLELHSDATAAVHELLVNREWLERHDLVFRARRLHEVPTRQVLELRACQTAAEGLYAADPLQAAAFSALFLRLALESGLVEFIVRALCGEAVGRATEGTRARSATTRYVELAQRLTAGTDDPRLSALVHSTVGNVAHAFGEVATAHESLLRAERILVEECASATSNLNQVRRLLNGTYAFLGQWRELAEHWDRWMADAQEHDDLQGLSSLSTGHGGYLRFLIVDDPERARRQVAWGRQLWRSRGPDLADFASQLSVANVEAYVGNYQEAFDIAQGLVSTVSTSPLGMLQIVRVQTGYSLGRAALNLASNGAATPRESLLEIARKQAERLAEEGSPMAEPYALHIEAGIAHLQGDREHAVKRLRETIAAFERCQCRQHVAAARRQLGQWLGGDEGRALMEQADAAMKQEGVRRPELIAAMVAFALPPLTSAPSPLTRLEAPAERNDG